MPIWAMVHGHPVGLCSRWQCRSHPQGGGCGGGYGGGCYGGGYGGGDKGKGKGKGKDIHMYMPAPINKLKRYIHI